MVGTKQFKICAEMTPHSQEDYSFFYRFALDLDCLESLLNLTDVYTKDAAYLFDFLDAHAAFNPIEEHRFDFETVKTGWKFS